MHIPGGITGKLIRVYLLQMLFISVITVLGVVAAAIIVEQVMVFTALQDEAVRERASKELQKLYDEMRPDHYVWPNYGRLPRGEQPSGDTSRNPRAHEGREDERRDDGYQLVEGEPEERLLNLLAEDPWLCVTEDAGAGKTVFSWRAVNNMPASIRTVEIPAPTAASVKATSTASSDTKNAADKSE